MPGFLKTSEHTQYAVTKRNTTHSDKMYHEIERLKSALRKA